jgi:hypothetical protein
VALAAMNARVHVLVTADKDFTDADQPIGQQLTIMLPGTFLREKMG